MGAGASSSVSVEGSVAPGYESVKEMFEHNFRRGAEESAQLCVYVGDEKVSLIYWKNSIFTLIGCGFVGLRRQSRLHW